MQTPTKLRKLTREDVDIIIETHPEWIPIRGNAILSDDPNYDRQVEDELIQRLSKGDIWAWCSVIVKAYWNGFEGEDYLGACSCADEEDFKRSDCYEDMVTVAINNLNYKVQSQFDKLYELVISDEPKPSRAQQIVDEVWERGIDLGGWYAVERHIMKTVNEMHIRSATVPNPYASSPERSDLLGEALRLASARYNND